jgi:hypothetical protein
MVESLSKRRSFGKQLEINYCGRAKKEVAWANYGRRKKGTYMRQCVKEEKGE